MPAPSDRSGQGGGLIMDRIVHAVEELWLERWSTLIAKPVTVATTGGLVTWTNHHLIANAPVVFTFDSGGDPLVTGITYYVRDVAADTFRVAATSGGVAIDITVDGVARAWTTRPSYIDQALNHAGCRPVGPA
jgi:hypothetical protein